MKWPLVVLFLNFLQDVISWLRLTLTLSFNLTQILTLVKFAVINGFLQDIPEIYKPQNACAFHVYYDVNTRS